MTALAKNLSPETSAGERAEQFSVARARSHPKARFQHLDEALRLSGRIRPLTRSVARVRVTESEMGHLG